MSLSTEGVTLDVLAQAGSDLLNGRTKHTAFSIDGTILELCLEHGVVIIRVFHPAPNVRPL